MRLRLQHILPALALALVACAKPLGLPTAKIAAPARTSYPAGSEIALDGSASDDGNGALPTLLWSFSALPAGSTAAIAPAGVPRPSFVADVPGTYSVQLIAQNRYYTSAAVSVSFTVTTCGVQRPTTGTLLASPAGPAVHVPVSLSAPAVADPDNDAATCKLSQKLTYAWSLVQQPAGSTARLNDATALAPAFTPDVAGAYQAQLIVTDDTGLASVPGLVEITANPCGGNVPVIASVSSSKAQPTVGSPFMLSAAVDDGDNSPTCGLHQTLSYQWSLVSQPLGSTARLNSGAVLSPSFVPDVGGAYDFRLVISDSTGLVSQAKDLLVNASACGSAVPQPTINVPAVASVGAPLLLSSAVVSDDTGSGCNLSESFSYAWRLAAQPTSSSAALNAPTSISPSFTPDIDGPYLVELTVTASNGKVSPTVRQTVTVSSCGKGVPAIKSIIASPSSPNAGQSIRVTAVIDNPDNVCAGFDPALSYRWQLIAKPSGSTAFLTDPSASTADFVADLAGFYQVSLVVVSSTGKASEARSLAAPLNAQPCGFAAPSVAAAVDNLTPDVGSRVTFSTVVSDQDNSSSCKLTQTFGLRWTLVSRPPGSDATVSDPGARNPTLLADKTGTYQVSVVATDSSGLVSAPAFVTFSTTSCAAGLPSVTATPLSLVIDAGTQVPLLANAIDPSSTCGLSTTFTYDWQVIASPLASSAVISNPRAAAPTFTPDVAGAYTLSVTVTNDRGDSSPPSFVHLTSSTCAELAPALGALAADQVGLGLTATLSAPGVTNNNCDARGATLHYRWSLPGKPLASTALLSDPAAVAPSLTFDVAGSYQVALSVENGLGLASPPAYLTLSVAACGSSSINFATQPIAATFTEPPAPLGTGAAVAVPNAGSRVSLAARAGSEFSDANPACGALATGPYRYRWALVSRPAGSTAQLSSSTDATPGFVTDVPGDYQVAVSITDALGTTSSTAFRTIQTSSCGANLPSVQIASLVAPDSQTPDVLDVLHLSLAFGAASDADNDPLACPLRFGSQGLRYRWSIISTPLGGRATLQTPDRAATTFEAFAPGVYTVQVVATAANGLSSGPATATFNVQPCGGAAPVVGAIVSAVNGTPSSSPNVSDNVSLTASALDANAACGGTIAAFTWAVVSLPPGSGVGKSVPVSTSGAAGETLGFVPDVAGSYVFTVVATSSRGVSSAPVPVSITTGTCAPTLSGITSSDLQPVIGAQLTLQLTSAVSDRCVASPVLTYDWELVSAPPGSTAMLGSTAPADATRRALSPDLIGTYVVSLVVTDQGGFASAPAMLVLPAATCGIAPPVASGVAAAPANPDVGTVVGLSVANIANSNALCLGQAVQPYTYHWSVAAAPAGSTARISASASATPVFVPDVAGSYQLAVVVTDALGNSSAPAFAALTTSKCGANVPSVSISAAASVNANYPLSLSASVSDADDLCTDPRFHGPSYTYAWSLVGFSPAVPGGPTGDGALSSAIVANPSFQASVPGDYLVALSVRASTGTFASAAPQKITVNACGSSAPQVLDAKIKVGGVTVSRPRVNDTVALTADAFDADNVAGACGTPLAQALTFTWQVVSAPAGSSVVAPGGASASPTFSFAPNVAGTYVFSVVATDSTGLASAPFTVTVPTGTCGPTLTGIASASTANLGELQLSHVPAVVTDSCATGGALTYAWTLTSRPRGSLAVLSFLAADAAHEAPLVTPDVAGNYGISLVVTDAAGFSSTATTSLPLGPCSARPTLTTPTFTAAEPDLSTPLATYAGDRITLGTTITRGACGAQSNGAYQYSWSLAVKPKGSKAALDSSTSPTPRFVADVPGGEYQVAVVVTDGLGNTSDPAIVTVDVNTCGAHPPAFLAPPATSASPLAVNATQPLLIVAAAADQNAGCPARLVSSSFSYAWSILSQPNGATPALSTRTGPATTFSSFTPGRYFVRVVATDARGVASAPHDTQVDVGTCGATPPAINAMTGTQALPAGAALTAAPYDANYPILVSADVTDPDTQGACGLQQSLTLRWALAAVPAGSAAHVSGTTGPFFSFTPDVAGKYTASVTATDSTGLSSSQTLDLVVSGCGTHAPQIADTGTTRHQFSATQVLPDGSQISSSTPFPALRGTPGTLGTDLALALPLQLSANIVDPDAGCVAKTYNYQWALVGQPTGSVAQLGRSATESPSLTPDVAGNYTVRLTVIASTGLSDTQVVVLPVQCGALPPTAVNGNGLSAFNATQFPGFIATVDLQGITSVTRETLPQPLDNGNVAFFPNQPITLSANVAYTDPPDCKVHPIVYSWRLASQPLGSRAVITAASSTVPTLVPDVAGEYDVALTLTDPVTGKSSTQTFTTFPSAPTRPLVAVSSCGITPPSATVTGPAFVVTGGLATLDASSVTDPDSVPVDTSVVPDAPGCGIGNGPTWSWSFTALPAQPLGAPPVTFDDPTLPTPSFLAPVDGTYVAAVVIKDVVASAPMPITVRTGSPSVANSTLTVSAAPTSTDAGNSAALTVTVLTPALQPLAGVAVSIAADGSANTFDPLSGSSGITDLNGVFTTKLSSTKAETKNVTATIKVGAAQVALPGKPVVFAPGAPAKLTLTPLTTPPATEEVNAPLVAQGGGPVVVDILDAQNNLTAATSNVTVALSSSGPCSTNGEVFTPVTVAASAGAATFSALTIGTIANGYCLVATSTGLTSVTSGLFNVGNPVTPIVAPTLSSAAFNTATNTSALSWTTVNNANLGGYNVYRDGTLIGSVPTVTRPTTTYGDGGRSGGLRNCYTVKSVTKTTLVVSTAPSNQVCVAAFTSIVPGAAKIGVSWTGDLLADDPGGKVDVYRSTSSPVAQTVGNRVQHNLPFSSTGGYFFDDTDPALAPDTVYHYVAVTNYSGSPTSVSQEGVGTLRPAAPGSLTAAGGQGEITLTWPAIADANLVGYNVYSCSGAACTPSTLVSNVPPANCSLGTCTFSNTSLSDAATFTYAVSTVVTDVSTGRSGTIESPLGPTQTATTRPSKPTLAGTANIADVTLNFACSGTCTSATFNLRRTGGTAKNFPGVTSPFTDSGAGFSTSQIYTYVVTVVIGGSSTDSDPLVIEAKPTAPGAVSTAGVTNTSVSLTWGASSANTVLYVIERSTDAGATFTQVLTSATTSATDTAVSPSTEYVYRVRAQNANGLNSDPTPGLPVSTTPAFLPASAGMNGGNVQAVAFAADGSLAYAGFGPGLRTPASGGIFVSGNRGTSWTQGTGLSLASNIAGISVAAKKPAVAWAINTASPLPNPTSVNRIYKTVNSGVTWTAQTPAAVTGTLDAVVVDPSDTNGNTAFVGGTGGVYGTTDGSTWSALTSTIGSPTVTALGIDATTATDNLYAGTATGLFKSTNKGASFAADNTGLGTSNAKTIRGIAVDTAPSPAAVYLATYDGLYERNTGSSSWTKKATLTPTQLESVAAYNGVIYVTASAPFQIWVSTDSGATWANATAATGLPPLAQLSGASRNAIAVDPSTPASGAHALVASAGLGGVYSTSNSGLSFAASNSGLTGASVKQLIYDSSSAKQLYVTTDAGLFKATLSTSPAWTAVPTAGLPAAALPVLGPIATDLVGGVANLYTMVAGTGLFKLANGQSSWAAVSGAAAPCNDFSGSTAALASLPGSTSTAIAAAANPAGGNQSICTSSDGGATFTAVANAIPAESALFIGYDAGNGVMDVLTTARHIFKVLTSSTQIAPTITPGGAAALTGALGYSYNALVTPQRFAADDNSNGAHGGIYLAASTMASWSNIGDPVTNALAAPLASNGKPVVLTVANDASAPGVAYAGTSAGGFWSTINAAAATPTWAQTASTAGLSVTQILVDPDGSSGGIAIFVGTDGNGVLRSGTQGQ